MYQINNYFSHPSIAEGSIYTITAFVAHLPLAGWGTLDQRRAAGVLTLTRRMKGENFRRMKKKM